VGTKRGKAPPLVCLWGGKSRGMLANVERLIELAKKVDVYVGPLKEFRTMRSPDDWENFVSLSPKHARPRAPQPSLLSGSRESQNRTVSSDPQMLHDASLLSPRSARCHSALAAPPACCPGPLVPFGMGIHSSCRSLQRRLSLEHAVTLRRLAQSGALRFSSRCCILPLPCLSHDAISHQASYSLSLPVCIVA
jgi:hypothetical protein